MKKITLLFLGLMLAVSSMFAGTGWFQDYVKIDVNGIGVSESTGTGWYWIGGDPGNAEQFAGRDFGAVSSLVLKGCDMKYWSDNQDRTGGAYYYIIKSADGSSDIKPVTELIWNHSYIGGNDYQGLKDNDVNLLEGLTPGETYQLHIYAKSWGDSQGDSWLSNDGNNYVATFTIEAKTTVQDGNWNEVSTWAGGVVPTASDNVIIAHNVTLIPDNYAEVNNIVVKPGKALVLSGALNKTGNLILQGDATNGAATLISDNAVEGKMTYPLSEMRTWYVSSPVNNSDVEALNSSSIYYYNETSGEYKNDATTMTNGLGYVIKPSKDVKMNFTGTFNTGEIKIPITKNSNTADKFRGYNLIGNPYPAILDFDKVVGQNPNLINPTLWYNVNGTFSAYNASGSLGSPANATKNIAPMQAFWVLYAADYTNDAANSQSGDLIFNNGMRLSNSSEANPLRAPRVVENQILRLQLVDDNNMKDETVIYFNAKAKNGYGDYDSRKMFNEKGSSLYTNVAGQKLVINGMNTIPYDKEIALNLLIKESGNFTISANEFSNFNGEKVWLRDNLKGVDHDLLSGDYIFTADENTTGTRFSVIFPRLDAPTGLEEILNDALSLSVDNGNLQVRVKDVAEDAMVSVFNSLGQRVASQSLRGTVTTVNLSKAGVYVVKVMNGSEELTEKVVVR